MGWQGLSNLKLGSIHLRCKHKVRVLFAREAVLPKALIFRKEPKLTVDASKSKAVTPEPPNPLIKLYNPKS